MLSIGSGAAPVSPMAQATVAQISSRSTETAADIKEYDYPVRAPAPPLRSYAGVPSQVTAEILRLRSEAAEATEAPTKTAEPSEADPSSKEAGLLTDAPREPATAPVDPKSEPVTKDPNAETSVLADSAEQQPEEPAVAPPAEPKPVVEEPPELALAPPENTEPTDTTAAATPLKALQEAKAMQVGVATIRELEEMGLPTFDQQV